ncbi:transposable element Tcb1 transposase [Trichonephila clavipes]|nr:transposable element Tcb1 transposase [Trichonephila clavipes]
MPAMFGYLNHWATAARLSFREIGQRVGRNQVTGCRRKRQTDDADRSHLVAPLTVMTGGFTIRRPLQQSGMFARRPLLRLPLTGNRRRLRRQWYDEWWIWTSELNDIVFTDESRFYLQHHDGRIRVWRHRSERLLKCCIMHRHTDPAPRIMV